MGAASGRKGKRGLIAVAVIAAVSGLVWAWGVDAPQPGDVSPADVVATRFPDAWAARAPASAATSALARAFELDKTPPSDPLEWLTSALMFDEAAQDISFAPPTGRAAGGADPLGKQQPAAIRIPRTVSRTAHLFNDAQIASVRERLKLSSDQQKLWAPVEAALRAIVWRGSRDRFDGKTATLDLRSLDQIKAAMPPFIKTLRAEQKDELRIIAHLMGLERLAAQL